MRGAGRTPGDMDILASTCSCFGYVRLTRFSGRRPFLRSGARSDVVEEEGVGGGEGNLEGEEDEEEEAHVLHDGDEDEHEGPRAGVHRHDAVGAQPEQDERHAHGIARSVAHVQPPSPVTPFH